MNKNIQSSIKTKLSFFWTVMVMLIMILKINAQGNYVVSGAEIGIYSTLGLNTSTQWMTARTTTPGYYSWSNGNTAYTGADDSHNINGYVKKYGNNAFTFPVGSGNDLRSLSISAPVSANDAYGVAWLSGNPSTTPDPTNGNQLHATNSFTHPIISVSNEGQWDWQVISGSEAGLTVTVSIPNATSLGNAADLRLVGWNGSSWVSLGTSGATSNTENSTLSGTMIAGIEALSIGVVCAAGIAAPMITLSSTSNACPTVSVNLSSLAITGSIPAETNIVWSQNNPPLSNADTLTTAQLNSVTTSGKYYAFFHSSSTACFSENADSIDVSITICEDTDGDGIPDSTDTDDDNDGLADINDPLPLDTDNDGTPNVTDTDDDGDGIADTSEAAGQSLDTDNDGNPNNTDADDDNDGIADTVEQGTCALICTLPDTDGDGLPDLADPLDTDGDGIPDSTDTDDDNDGLADINDPLPLDTDNDGTPNVTDTDDDGDGIADTSEAAGQSLDTDNDGNPNNTDTDDDNDGIADTVEQGTCALICTLPDTDGDGLPDLADPLDTDGDGIPDSTDTDDDNDGLADINDPLPLDTDNDGTPNVTDTDDDGDGIADTSEAAGQSLDTDNDGNPNNTDTDDDNDGIADTVEQGTCALICTLPDTDGDGLPDLADPLDTDGDGIPDSTDTDDDNDGLADINDPLPLDTDNDGTPNVTDTDDDGDGIADTSEAAGQSLDTDNDGNPNNTDTDDDNDGIADTVEQGTCALICTLPDTDGDGLPDLADPLDTDGDGIPDSTDTDDDNDGLADINDPLPLDTDNDGTPNVTDTDDDGDGIADTSEAAGQSLDTDNDGNPNNTDADDDNDGIADTVEQGTCALICTLPDTDGDGLPDLADPLDTDGDGIPDSTDTDDDNDGLADINDPLPLDTDNDGTPNVTDTDDDGDGIADTSEAAGQSLDTDNDGNPNNTDTDDDNDGIADTVEQGTCALICTLPDTDGDGLPDLADPLDTDGDGIPDSTDTDDDNDGLADINDPLPLDTDNDGTPNVTDTDDDGDGIADTSEAAGQSLDTDNDGNPNNTDADDDNDGIADTVEQGTCALICTLPDTDGDGLPDLADPLDTDGDGIPDSTDTDDDNDGLADINDPLPLDTDNDGTPNVTDTDDDGDGIADTSEAAGQSLDTDNDGNPNNTDADDDNDGIADTVEQGTCALICTLPDTDGDGLPDLADPLDTDGDGIPNGVDIDDDNDGLSDNIENSASSGPDTDNDGIINSMDLDSDNDGVNDINENGSTGDSNYSGYIDGSETLVAGNNAIAPYNGPASATGTDIDGDGILSSADGRPSIWGDTLMCINMALKVFLEGPYVENGSNGVTMGTHLNVLGYLPGQKPVAFFGTETAAGQPYSVAPWNHLGTEGSNYFYTPNVPSTYNAGYPSNATDWVLVSLRTGLASNTTVCTKAALLLSNGSIQMIAGFDCCELDMSQTYYIVVEHRSHMIVMSHQKMPITSNTITYDFTTQQSYKGLLGFGQKLINGKYVMYSGNGQQVIVPSADTDINVSDKDLWLIQNGLNSSYYLNDFDLNGDTNVQDKNRWLLNNGIFSDVPRN